MRVRSAYTTLETSAAPIEKDVDSVQSNGAVIVEAASRELHLGQIDNALVLGIHAHQIIAVQLSIFDILRQGNVPIVSKVSFAIRQAGKESLEEQIDIGGVANRDVIADLGSLRIKGTGTS